VLPVWTTLTSGATFPADEAVTGTAASDTALSQSFSKSDPSWVRTPPIGDAFGS